MPYIKQKDRKRLLDGGIPQTPGELNFLLTADCLSYILTKGEGYSTYNDVIGALESAKLEFYRRKVSLYEEEKINENGDVY